MISQRDTLTLVEATVLAILIALGGNYCYLRDKDPSGSAPPAPQEQGEPTALHSESPTERILKVVLVGLLVLGGIVWQVYLIQQDEDEAPTRVIPAGIAGAILCLGVIVVSVIEIVDSRRELSVWTALTNTGKVGVLAISLLVKSYFAPITASLTLSCVVYFLVTYGELKTIPLIQGLFDWTFAGAPRWVSWTYVSLLTLYSLGGAIHDSDI